MHKLLSRIIHSLNNFPDRIALQDGGRTLTYAELDRRSAHTASAIAAEAKSNSPVIIDVPRGLDHVVAAIAALRSGRGFVPLDRGQPSARVENAIRSAAAELIIRRQPGDDASTRLRIERLPEPALDTGDMPGSIAYIVFTSGSTGEPKGVEMGVDTLAFLVDWHLALEESARAIRTAQFAPMTFDVAWEEIFTSLALGGSLHFVPEDARSDPEQYFEFLSERAITRAILPTAFLRAVAEVGSRSKALSGLRDLFVGGSQLRVTAAIRTWFKRNPQARLHNLYGPSETHVVCHHALGRDPESWQDLPPMGVPFDHVGVLIADETGAELPRDSVGELYLSGCLANGYRKRPDLTRRSFVERDGRRWYRTGDLVRFDEDDNLWFEGRADRQIKIDGHRVEPGEVEARISELPGVKEVHVAALRDRRDEPRLVAYVITSDSTALSLPEIPVDSRPDWEKLAPEPWRQAVSEVLTPAATPSAWYRVDHLPLTDNGKVDQSRLPTLERERPPMAVPYARPRTATELFVAKAWEEVLDLDGVGLDDNFFDLGGSSMSLAQVVAGLRPVLEVELRVADAYASPTVRAFARHVDVARGDTSDEAVHVSRSTVRGKQQDQVLAQGGQVAIVGMACRFPGADTPEEFWSNLREGRESIQRRPNAVDKSRVFASGVLSDVDMFDAAYFGLTTEQAELLDPQTRIFLECAVEALEDAGCAAVHEGVGVYAGSGLSTYLLNNLLLQQREPISQTSSIEAFDLIMANDKEFLPSRAAYLLDLRGPALNVNAACATALYAIHFALNDLRSGACDVALAGASLISSPQLLGHVYDPALPFSPDGHTRPFDENAAGTVFSNGVGTVVLKRLADALAAGDHIHAVIRGSGVSNDGAQKVGMTAPSVQGEERAIRNALKSAQVSPRTIGYVETHGTATAVGDVIEVDALRKAYGDVGEQTITLGSVKSNIGHLGAAAGVAGVIKAVMMLKHREVPPTLHFRRANPSLLLDQSPFRVAADLEPLTATQDVHRIGVSAFGVGGFNAHLILESPPNRMVRHTSADQPWFVVPISAKSKASHDELVKRLRTQTPDTVEPADVARTLATGRRHHTWRSAILLERSETLRTALARKPANLAKQASVGASTIALFAGHGFERRGVGRELFETEPVFREAIEQFDDVALKEFGAKLSDLFYAEKYRDAAIDTVSEGHALSFAGQLALLRLAESKGVRFDAYLGHSTGQYVAACAAGVFTAADGFRIAVERGRAIEKTAPDGTMAKVSASEATVVALIAESGLPIDLATVNGNENVVVSGLAGDLDRFVERAEAAGFETTMLKALRAGHSRWMSAASEGLTRALKQAALTPPAAPVICNVTGRIAGPEIATVEYWVEHLTRPVRFRDCLTSVSEIGGEVYIELSGATGLLALAADALGEKGASFIALQRPKHPERQALAEALGAAFEAGVDLDWDAVNGSSGRVVSLARYPFDRTSYWTGPVQATPEDGSAATYEVRWIDGSDGETSPPSIQAPKLVELEPVELESELDPVEALRPGITKILDLVKDHTTGEDNEPPSRVWLVFRGAQKVRAEDRVSAVHRALWGLGRILAAECTHLRPILVDLPENPSPEDYRALEVCAGTGTDETEIAIRDGVALCGRLVQRAAETRPATLELRPDRTYLVSGGLTGLGLWTAKILAEHGAKNLLLIGRRPPGEGAVAEVRALRERGVQVEVESVDIADPVQVDDLFRSRQDSVVPIGGVVHSAAVLSDCLLENLTFEGAVPVLAAKATGAWNLHRSSVHYDAPIDFFALYSAGAALVGNYGQGAYAAANAYLDGLAHIRSAAGLPAVSFVWGVHRDVGLVSEMPDLLEALDRSGYGPLAEPAARDAVVRNLVTGKAETIVLGTEWETFFEKRGGTPPAFYSELAQGMGLQRPEVAATATVPRPSVSTEPTVAATPADQLRQLAPELRGAFALDSVQTIIGRYLTPGQQSIHPDAPIAGLGLDSLSLIQLRNNLQKNFDTVLPPRLLMSYPTPRAVAALIIESAAGATSETPADHRERSCDQSLSLEQQRWLSIATGVGGLERVIAVVFHEKLDHDALRRSLVTVVERHDVLRQFYPSYQSISTIGADDVVPAAEELFVDLSAHSDEVAADLIGEHLRQLEGDVPDPSESPSWRVRCLELSNGRFLLALAATMLQVDGPGLAVFYDELRRCYGGFASGLNQIPLAAAPSYTDYVQDQADYLSSDLVEARAHFAGLYAGMPGPTLLPGSQGLGEPKAQVARRYTPAEPLGDFLRLNETAEALGVVPFAVVLGSYATLVAEICGTPSVCIPIVRNSRFQKSYADTIGPFTQLFPIPVYVSGWSVEEVVRQVDDRLALLTAHPRYPSSDLIDATRTFAGLPRETGFSEASINYMSYPARAHDDGPVVEMIQSLGPVRHPLFAQYDFSTLRRMSPLHVVAVQDQGKLVANYWYHQKRFSEAEVSTWASRHRDITQSILAPK